MAPSDGALGDLSYELIRLPDRRYTFTGKLLHADESMIVVDAQVTPSRPLVIEGREVIGNDYRAVWFLFKGEPWDIGRFYRPDGELTGYYADALQPVQWQDDDPSTLEPLVDLFLDLWVGVDGSVRVLDEDELQEAIENGAIDEARAARARQVISELLTAARAGTFPPDVVRGFVE